MWLVFLIIGFLLFIQFGHMYQDWSYKHKLETDPKFRLLEKTKSYMHCFVKYEPGIWLDSKTNGNIKFYEHDFQCKEKILYEAPIDDPFVKEIFEAKKIKGYEIKECRECGAIDFELKNSPSLNGFCEYNKCSAKCSERDLRHLGRIYNVDGEASHLFNSRSDLDYRCKLCYNRINFKGKYRNIENVFEKQNIICAICKGKIHYNAENKIPMFEYAKKQNFVCAICAGNMNHIWDNNNYYSKNNYLYHTIDHIFPISKGGKHEGNNIQIVHFICNLLKGTGENIKLSIKAENFIDENTSIIHNEDLLIKTLKKHLITGAKKDQTEDMTFFNEKLPSNELR